MIRFLLAVCLALLALPARAVTVERVVSPGGIEAWLVQDHANPILALEISFAGGASVEAKAGTATLVAALLDEGAGPYDSQAFQGKLDDLAIALNFAAGKDRFGGHLKTLTEHRDTAFDLLRLALTQPRFDKEPVERIRGQILAGLAREQQSPEAVATKAFYRLAFAGHPYGRPMRGDPDTVKAITTAELKAFARTWISRQDLIIGVSGDITPAELAPLLDRTFGALPARHPDIAIGPARNAAPGRTEVLIRDNPQSIAMFGADGIKRDDADWWPAYVVNYILGGGGFSSRLTEEVREKRGLAYSVYSYLTPFAQGGLIIGGVATENARIAQSLDLIKAEWRRMAETGPTEAELANAKTYLTGSFPLSLDSTAAIAGLLVAMQSDKLGLDYLDRRNALVESVSAEAARRAARNLLDADALTIVVVGRPEGLTGR
jgi:zinc protease